jgi:hypothetical protein
VALHRLLALLCIIAESGPGTDNSKLNVTKRNIFQKYKVTDPKDVAQLIEIWSKNYCDQRPATYGGS